MVEARSTELRRTAGFWTIVSLTVTAMVGTGLFFGISLAAKFSGVNSILAWVLLGALSIYIGCCFGELISMFPQAGGVYEFSKQAYGTTASFVIGWVTWMVGNVTAAILIVAAFDYLLPNSWSVWVIPISILVILLINTINFFGIEASGMMLNIFAVISILSIVLFTVLGFIEFDPTRFEHLFSVGPVALFASLFFILEALMGWESASYMAEETINPAKIIPKALFVSSFLVSVIAVLLALSILGAAPIDQVISSERIIEEVAVQVLGTAGGQVVAIALFLTLIGSALGSLVATPRLLLSLARDKLFFDYFAYTHPTYKSPHWAIVFQTAFIILVVILTAGIYQDMLSILVVMALVMYILVLMIIPLLRYREPTKERPFKVWFGKSGPILVSLIYAFTVISWALREESALELLKIAGSFLLFGVPIWLFLSFLYNPDFLRNFMNIAAPLNYFFENLFFPKHLRKTLVGFEALKGKRVLEYGAGVGSLTIQLAEQVGPRGRVYATDHSEVSLRFLNRRVGRKEFLNVQTIHDPHHTSRVHPSVPPVDYIFSVGMLSYLQEPKKILEQMHDLLSNYGRVCLVEYIDMFGIFPNPKWLSNPTELKALFRKVGFSLRIVKKSGILWNYLVLYALKTEDDVPFI